MKYIALLGRFLAWGPRLLDTIRDLAEFVRSVLTQIAEDLTRCHEQLEQLAGRQDHTNELLRQLREESREELAAATEERRSARNAEERLRRAMRDVKAGALEALVGEGGEDEPLPGVPTQGNGSAQLQAFPLTEEEVLAAFRAQHPRPPAEEE